jgi:cyclic pyranopterin monophosphate synthase
MREGNASRTAGGAAGGRLEMVDVGPKPATRRRATARGRIRMSRAAFEAVRQGTNPKGDVLAQAEVAGILAAKRTAEVIPLCHPLALDQVRVRFALEPEGCAVLATCDASTTARTGVEMEALSGVTGALLAVYDLAKAIDPALTISDVHVSTKEGGKSGRWANPLHAHEERLP